ncbi:MAG: McrB family protein [Eubacterium sp.]
MAMIKNLTEENIMDALTYIDKNGVPDKNKSTQYELVTKEGKKYPPKYVIAVAEHIAYGTNINTNNDYYNSISANNYLSKKGFTIETKQEKYELIITEDSINSTDERFTMDNLTLGNNYKPLDAYFKRADGKIIKRNYDKGERRNSNQTLPRIACQVFEKQIAALTPEEKENFPVCRYSKDGELLCGIYPSVDKFKQYRKTIEYMIYNYDNGRQFVIYCWNIFSTIIFVQECLKNFGEQGDSFVLIYRDKESKEIDAEQYEKELAAQENLTQQFKGYLNPYSEKLIESKNIIFRGAPGTGKTYLARQIAADIVSNGYFDDYTMLTPEQKKQIEFVQFHPSYDYSDFVEGLRPKINDDGSMGFELQDGIFKRFVDRARKNYENSLKSKEVIEKEMSVEEAIADFFSNIEFGVECFETITGNKFYITNVSDSHIYIKIPDNETVDTLSLSLSNIRVMLESGEGFEKIKDITNFFNKVYATQAYSYEFVLYKKILESMKDAKKVTVKQEELKKFVFIIDEINRGEISKILGELFFSVDPSYRGHAGEVSTQYSNLHSNPDEKFFIPENVYIIGTMNDIDRSVDSFDFAMRRRFRFIEIKADEMLEMIDSLEDEELKAQAMQRMASLNREIAIVPDLNENYQIGGSYFLKLKTMSFDQLWTDCLKPLLQEYIQGMYDQNEIMKRFEKAYGYSNTDKDNYNEATEN